jgi:hypothetical protein
MSKRMTPLTILLTGVASLAVLVLLYGCYRTWKTGRMPEHAEFAAGTVPASLPEGLWQGMAPELGKVSWQGKKFLSPASGINLFEKNGVQSEAYPFVLKERGTIGFGHRRVLALDYNQAGNPLWLRLITDEMVTDGQGGFIGIVYVRLVPGFPFRMGYFRLLRPA